MDLDVGPRRAERCVVASALLFAAVTPLFLPFGGLVGAAISMACVVLAWLGFRAAGWTTGPRRVIRVSWRSTGQWMLTDSRGNELPAELRPDTRIGTSWVWLRWNAEDVRSMLLIRGDVGKAELRRLCLRLRLDRPVDLRTFPATHP